MPKRIEISEILKRNPQIVPEDLEKSREMLRKLRESGVRAHKYSLVSPFAGKRVSVSKVTDAETDARTFRLKRSSVPQ